MKSLSIWLSCFLISGMLSAQSVSQNDVPAVVLNAFQLKFPNAEDMKWKLSKGNYQVEFRIKGKPHLLKMDERGKLVEHTQDLFVSEIPAQVMNTIASRAAYYDIHDADRHESPGQVIYEINYKIEGKNQLFLIGEDGVLLKYRKELQNSEVPPELLELIKTAYGPLDLDRGKFVEEPGLAIYIIRGEIHDHKHVFTFDAGQTMLRHQQDLRDSEIPSPVMETFHREYPGYEIRDANLLEEGMTATCTLKIRKSRDTRYITLDTKGLILEEKK